MKKRMIITIAVLLCVLFLVVGVPIIINECYKIGGSITLWNAADVLAYYGTERTDFPQSGQQKCPESDGKSNGLHPRLVGLLRDCKHEDDNAELGRMAAKKMPLLYLEAVEEPQNESEESNKAGNSRVGGLQVWKLPKGLLAIVRNDNSQPGYIKRKTRTSGILQHPGPVRVCALMRLNRRIPNGMYGGVRGRLGSQPPTRFI